MKTGTPLTIALVLGTPGTTWGGMEKHTAELAGALAKRGHQIHVIAHKAFSERFPHPLHFHPCPMQLGRKNPWLWLKLDRLIRKIEPEVLHAQGNKAAELIGRVRGDHPCTRIGTIHGIKSNERAFSNCSVLIAVSRSVYERLEHPGKKLIYNGVKARPDAAARPRPTPGDRNKSTTNVLAVGRLVHIKGFDVLIRAWGPVMEAFPECHLTILGDGEERDALERLVAELGLENHISFPGYVESTEPWYERSDLTVISSLREGFSYVLLEALMAECPVLSTPVSGPKELLPPEALTQDHSAESLAELLSSKLGNLQALRDLEQAAMTRVRRDFTVDAMADQTERAYLSAKLA